MSGVTRQSYSPEIRIIRLMCTGRVDLSFIFRAFMKGADGVIIGGCWPGECHYVTEGNYDALGNMYLCKKLLANIGLSPERIRLEWIAASEGSRFAEVMTESVERIKGIGILGKGEGINEERLNRGLRVVSQLIPYVKLVERERLRVPSKSEMEYREFFESEETNNLFSNLIADKLTMGQILLLLEKSPLSTGEISEALDLNPSEVSKYMNNSSRKGLVRYEMESNCYVIA